MEGGDPALPWDYRLPSFNGLPMCYRSSHPSVGCMLLQLGEAFGKLSKLEFSTSLSTKTMMLLDINPWWLSAAVVGSSESMTTIPGCPGWNATLVLHWDLEENPACLFFSRWLD